MEWVLNILSFSAGALITAFVYRRNRKHMDKLVDAGKAAVKAETKKIAGKIKEKVVK